MDTDLLIAELLLRGFEHHKDDNEGRKIYTKDRTAIAIREDYAVVIVASKFTSVEETLEVADYVSEKANGD